MSAEELGHAVLHDSGATRGNRLAVDDNRDQSNSFVYTTYIHATREQVWQGLTDPAYTTRWWRHHAAGGKAFPSDWRVGSTYDLSTRRSGWS